MKTAPVTMDDLRGVFAVPPLARRADKQRSIDFEQNERIVKHIAEGGITRFLYGGNAFLYHITLREYEQLLEWLSGFASEHWVIPSIGPSYGRAIDQAALLRRYKFPCVMMLPCCDPREAAGLERGLYEFAEEAGTRLILYLKDENGLGADKEAGLDVVARLIKDELVVGIKYAVLRQNPAEDAYLDSLLRRVERNFVISGIGERPAIIHLREWHLPSFTTGSGCIAPYLSQAIYQACMRSDYQAAEDLRAKFLPLEDLRDAWGPAQVLHTAAALVGIAQTGPVPPYQSSLTEVQMRELAPVVRTLARR